MSHPLAHVRRSFVRGSFLLVAALTALCVFADAPALAQTSGGAGKPAASSRTRRRVARRRTRRRPAAADKSAPTKRTPVTIVGVPDVDANPEVQPPPAAPGASFGERPKKPVTLGHGILNGKAISKPEPPYPAIAKAARAQGTVTVQILVDEEGKVISAHAVSGHPLLQQAAVQAARQARFSPTLLSGQPVRVSGVITYNFVLQ